MTSSPQLKPLQLTQVLLFGDRRNYGEYADVISAATIEAERFFSSAGLIQKCRRFFCFPGAGRAMREVLGEELPTPDEGQFSSTGAKVFWEEMRARYSKTYEHRRIGETVSNKFLPGDTGKLFIMTDQEICPPQGFRYILWDGFKGGSVISTAPMDPRYWGESADNPRKVIKHRFRTALINAMGEHIGFSRCEEEDCLEFYAVDSVTRLDAMRYFGAEHQVPALTDRGFAPETPDPAQVQPIVTHPPPPKSWGSYA